MVRLFAKGIKVKEVKFPKGREYLTLNVHPIYYAFVVLQREPKIINLFIDALKMKKSTLRDYKFRFI